MGELNDFGLVVFAVAAAAAALLATSQLTARLPLPGAAFFLLAAAGISNLVPQVRDEVAVEKVERLAVAALIVILFDGGMKVGWRRFRVSALPVSVLGILATAVTAVLVALIARYALGFGWLLAGIIGGALAPTDPAVMFSVLRGRQLGGRAATALEGESGINDPVSIAIVVGLLDYADGRGSLLAVGREFVVEMAVGAAVGLAVGIVFPFALRHAHFSSEGLFGIAGLVAAGLAYGGASMAHGSGFLAVFVLGVLLGAERTPRKVEIERFGEALASFSEMAVFAALGLTFELSTLGERSIWFEGILLALLLVLVVRPIVVLPLLAPLRMDRRERLFVAWAGMKGAVPILLASFVLIAGVEEGQRIYDIVFVVVAFSVIVQGSSLPWVAARLRIPMRVVEPEPWDVSIRLRHEPRDLRRFVVAPDARAIGRTIRELPLGENTWISLVVRDGEARQPRGSYVVQAGDEILALADQRDVPALGRLFGAGSSD
jgi:cell volume regulation protein A